MGYMWRGLMGCLPFLFVFCLGLSQGVSGSPCSDGSHTCDTDTQRCVEVDDNSGTNFSCECLKSDQQLDASLVCTDLPDSQILYLTTPIDATNSNYFLIIQVLSSPSLSQQTLESLFNVSDFPNFKDVKFFEFRGLGPIPNFSVAIYAFLFSQNVTDEIRRKVALAVLELEKNGEIRAPNGATVEIAGYTGIFNTLAGTSSNEDDMDWCSDPLLYSCRANSTCQDGGLRYDCPCNSGFKDIAGSCYICEDEFRYGPGCNLACGCVINNTVSCDHANGRCLCKEHWEGERCDRDVKECTLRDICGDPAFYRCIDVLEGYQCACAEGMLEDKATGLCRGASIKYLPSPFETDGTRDLHLVCEVSLRANESVTQYEWRDVFCLEAEAARCTIRPQPPWDDGKTVTCIARLDSRESFTASSELTLIYPPPSAPHIEGYTSRERLRSGDLLDMTCTVAGGKPLVSAVLFSCPRHPDVTADVIGPSHVSSVLAWRLTSEDDEAVCTCRALWRAGQKQDYSLSTTIVLKVVPPEDTDGDAMDFKWYIIFGALGVFFIAIIAISIVICRTQARKKYSSSKSSTGNTSPGTSTEEGTSQPTVDNLGSQDSGYSAPQPNSPFLQQGWRSDPWLFRPRFGSADDLDSWTVERRIQADGQRHQRRNSTGAQSGIYDQISAGVLPNFFSGTGSDLYLHPSLYPGHRPLPIPHHLHGPDRQAALPPNRHQDGSTGVRL